MKPNDNIQTQPPVSKDDDLSLCTLLIEELRPLHKVLIDNLRVMLTFNSLVLPASFALFVLTARGKISKNQYPIAYLLLICLAPIGSIVKIISLLIIRPIKAVTSLHQSQEKRREVMVTSNHIPC